MNERTKRQLDDDIFAYYKKQAQIVDIDENMQLLVKTLNQLPGIATIACCGGHENPSRIQRPAGAWFVTIVVYRYDERGWNDLDIIHRAISRCRDRVSINFFSAETATFFLDGKEINPDDFAYFVFEAYNKDLAYKKTRLPEEQYEGAELVT
jgi:hypothetical protein